ncbi:MAG TPA: zinc-binding dehydrogenase, partial [Gemmobacter sp.]|nr:zinc-binding dehydrogenase [Gemmobacter sp.]
AKLGYSVVALTGRAEEAEYLSHLGAARILDREVLSAPGKPLAREQWAGAVDVVGGQVLANVCAGMKYRGVVTACGLAGGMGFPATVAPFILRGVTLVGIDSVMAPKAERIEAWRRLARDLDPGLLATMTRRIALEEVPQVAEDLIAGRVRGRVIVPVQG